MDWVMKQKIESVLPEIESNEVAFILIPYGVKDITESLVKEWTIVIPRRLLCKALNKIFMSNRNFMHCDFFKDYSGVPQPSYIYGKIRQSYILCTETNPECYIVETNRENDPHIELFKHNVNKIIIAMYDKTPYSYEVEINLKTNKLRFQKCKFYSMEDYWLSDFAMDEESCFIRIVA